MSRFAFLEKYKDRIIDNGNLYPYYGEYWNTVSFFMSNGFHIVIECYNIPTQNKYIFLGYNDSEMVTAHFLHESDDMEPFFKYFLEMLA